MPSQSGPVGQNSLVSYWHRRRPGASGNYNPSKIQSSSDFAVALAENA